MWVTFNVSYHKLQGGGCYVLIYLKKLVVKSLISINNNIGVMLGLANGLSNFGQIYDVREGGLVSL